jgi:hypothetical protein
MNPLGILLTAVAASMLLVCRRSLGALPMLIAALVIPRSQMVQLGSLSFPAIRILIVAGFLRVLFKRERIAGGMNKLDWLLVMWACWLIFSELFRTGMVSMVRLGDAYTILGIYFLFRVFVSDQEDLRSVIEQICLLLVPIAICMLIEKASGRDIIASLFGESDYVRLREGHFRARGPYANAILAGTNGAACLPMALYLWHHNKRLAWLGVAAMCGMVVASGSSGPINTALAAVVGIGFWKHRRYLPAARWGFLVVLVGLDLVMKDPVYYIVARLDIHAGSTGWYRARLMQGAIEHLNEWWLVGTDFTHHWVPEGTSGIAGNHADITNHFIQMGVWGGLGLMVLFISFLIATFSTVGKWLESNLHASFQDQLLIWALGVMLFAHTVTFMSVSYFDPSIILLFYLTVAAVSSIGLSSNAKAMILREGDAEHLTQPLVCYV